MAYQADVSDGLIGRCVLLRSSLTSLSKCVFQVTPLIVSEKPPAKWKAKEKDATETLQKRLREGQSNILVRPIPGVDGAGRPAHQGRPLEQVRRRGRWAALSSVQRYTRAFQLGRHFSENRR